MITSAINNLIGDLAPRQKEILSGRFGLENGKRRTLAALGKRYGITRERVRQIEKDALEASREKLANDSAFKYQILNPIVKCLEIFGGLRRSDLFIDELKAHFKNGELHYWHLKFISETAGRPYYYSEDENFRHFWYVDDGAVGTVNALIKKLEQAVSGKKEESARRKFSYYFDRVLSERDFSRDIGLNYVSVSKKFHVNSFGDIGLSRWEEINPKTVRAKIYLVLKKLNKPAHFTEITELVNKAAFDSRRALPQTVHNELIKHPEIVLVGRGIYGLKEHGYAPGACREVIRKIIKEKGPLSTDEVVGEVLRQRILKANTILLNLQNKKHFKRLADGRYNAIF